MWCCKLIIPCQNALLELVSYSLVTIEECNGFIFRAFHHVEHYSMCSVRHIISNRIPAFRSIIMPIILFHS